MRQFIPSLAIAFVSFAGLSFLGVGASGAERGVRAPEVPRAVGDAVRHRHPHAVIVRYVREDEKGTVTYEVSVRDNGVAEDITVSPEGRILAEERKVTKADLPAQVRTALVSELDTKGRIVTIERIVDPENEVAVKFEVMLRRGGDLVELTFDQAGRIVKRETARPAR
jgi:hypothetical protein